MPAEEPARVPSNKVVQTSLPSTYSYIDDSGNASALNIQPQKADGDAPTIREKAHDMQSIHGDSAAKRRAITELLFFAGAGDVRRCQRIVRLWNLDVSDPACADYDKRTPLHLAASEGAFQVTEWLLSKKARVNAVDRFKRTPLQDAVIGGHPETASFIKDHGGQVFQEGKLIPVEESKLQGALPDDAFGLSQDWEIEADALEIKEKLGEGEFGIVHKAFWNGTIVAVKILKSSDDIALGDFRAELEVLRRVHHPNAVQFLGAVTKKQPYILVTELMSGGSLADSFKFTQVFSLRRAVEICLDTARGLAYMHLKKPAPIIHRDLKPNNLMFSGTMYHKPFDLAFDCGVVKLADFGLSKTLPINKHAKYDLDDKFRLTGETGSYRYMAPEVFRHEPYNPKVDVYSFSMIAYQLFEHQPAFAGMDPVEAARQAALYEGRPPFNTLVNPKAEVAWGIRELIERMWAPDPEDRPTFMEIVHELEKFLDKLPRKIAPKQLKDVGASGGGGGGGGGDGGCCSVQ